VRRAVVQAEVGLGLDEDQRERRPTGSPPDEAAPEQRARDLDGPSTPESPRKDRAL
jgi:hypothetical protein